MKLCLTYILLFIVIPECRDVHCCAARCSSSAAVVTFPNHFQIHRKHDIRGLRLEDSQQYQLNSTSYWSNNASIYQLSVERNYLPHLPRIIVSFRWIKRESEWIKVAMYSKSGHFPLMVELEHTLPQVNVSNALTSLMYAPGQSTVDCSYCEIAVEFLRPSASRVNVSFSLLFIEKWARTKSYDLLLPELLGPYILQANILPLTVCTTCHLRLVYGVIKLPSGNNEACPSFLNHLLEYTTRNVPGDGPGSLYINNKVCKSFPSMLKEHNQSIIILPDKPMLNVSGLCSCMETSIQIPTHITTYSRERRDNDIKPGTCSSVMRVVLSVSASVIVLFLVCAVLVYRYRWKIRYVYHLVRNNDRHLEAEDENDFDYDAFVAYADEDREWVIQIARLKLEEEFGFRLCIHHRDFIPGQAIADNIAEAIAKSKRVSVVLSPHFLQSYWCNYEVEMAKYEGIRRGRNVIIVVVLKDIKLRNVTKELGDLMKIISFATFSADPLGQQVFWDKMKRAIRI